jgi:hypothetical protein
MVTPLNLVSVDMQFSQHGDTHHEPVTTRASAGRTYGKVAWKRAW